MAIKNVNFFYYLILNIFLAFNSTNLLNPCLLLTTGTIEFDLIHLPANLKTLDDVFKNTQCKNCNSIPEKAIICLICGEKLCFTDKCCKNIGKNRNVLEYVYHNKLCGQGDGVFLNIENGQIIFSLLYNFCLTNISLYTHLGITYKEKDKREIYKLDSKLYDILNKDFGDFKYPRLFKFATKDKSKSTCINAN